MVNRLTMLAVAFGLLFVPFDALADTATIEPLTDAMLSTHRTGVNWAGQSAGTADSIDSSGVQSEIFVGYDGDTYIRRFGMIFDLDEAAIPVGSTVDSLTLRLYVNGKNNVKGDVYSDVTFVDFDTSSDTSISTSDYGECGTTRYATDVPIDSVTTSAYNEYALNSTAITLAEAVRYFKVCVREGHDVDNQAWGSTSGYNWVYFKTFNAASDHPELVIEYTPPVDPPDPPPTGSGSLYGSGSLIIGESACDAFADVGSGSGASQVCSLWSHSINVEALRFFVQSNVSVVGGFLTAGLLAVVLYKWIISILRWFWKIFAHEQ